MITLGGTLIGIGGASGVVRTAEIQLLNVGAIEIRGLSEKQCRDLSPSLFDTVAIVIATEAESKQMAVAVLQLSDRNPLLDAVRWLEGVPRENGNYNNAVAVAEHLRGMIARINEAKT